ncbi:hypothetical protein ASD64_18280 [Mesorhizobium sp. Root157]|uniref:relaxase/mobilization nuclease domain-containing protein n=1 Tax=Mesorhizobium sp. Root157 TaxID=1736477 RepID=UPI0006F983CD|nr:relaxase/mobilization nuclease domain-containing protein [Mesorhizobium sp. Root157]KQZ95859.1 hypothetical protein ASD64_18280 [Mesorhizobium sp. Root157]
MRTRFQALASGSQPAVVKLASYGGSGRVGAMISYVARAGRLALENQRGERVSGKDALSGLRSDWACLFDNRADSRDVAVFNVRISPVSCDGKDRGSVAREILQTGFGDRRLVFVVDDQGGDDLTIRGVVVLRHRSGERLTGDGKAAQIVQQRFESSEFSTGIEAHFRFHGFGNGVRFATARVRDLVERFNGQVRDETGRLFNAPKDARDLVQKTWRHEMHSRKGRDVMHLIVSARAGTDLAAFQSAVRDFLGEQFAGHRYVFAVHDPSGDPKEMVEGGKRPHIHAHAIVTMRSETGERIITSPQVFREWRELMAAMAREHGIDMELTDRRDRASPPAYTGSQVRPVSWAGRTEHEGTSKAAQARYDAKRQNLEMGATTHRSQSYMTAAAVIWRELVAEVEEKGRAEYAVKQIERIKVASQNAKQTSEKRLSTTISQSNLTMLTALIEIEEAVMQQMTRPEFEAYEKRVEAVLSNVEANIEPSARQDYDQIAAAARDVVNILREYLELRGNETNPPLEGRPEIDNDAWNRAVALRGEQTVERDDDVILEVVMTREIAEMDKKLQLAINKGERTQKRFNGERTMEADERNNESIDGRPAFENGNGPIVPAANVAPGAVAAEVERQSALLKDVERERLLPENPMQNDQLPGVDERNLSTIGNAASQARSIWRESPSADPPQQQVPRMEELKREIEEWHESERDDREP